MTTRKTRQAVPSDHGSRTAYTCAACGQIDDHPKHHLPVGPALFAAVHLDCCMCEDDTYSQHVGCSTVIAGADGLRGLALAHHIENGGVQPAKDDDPVPPSNTLPTPALPTAQEG